MADGVKPAGWWHESDDGAKVVCDLCPRGCSMAEGKRGFCFVRQNLQGQLVTTTYGRSSGFCIDPIEKKPLNHFYPGSSVLSFGTAGCNLGCKFCQNWEISKSREIDALGQRADPETVARAAQQLGCQSVAFTYNDPVVWSEYATDCARACRAVGVKTVAVTAGYITPLARKAFFATMDAANVDLKGFTEEFYREQTGSRLAPVQDTLQWLAHESNTWLEVTNLLIPGKNDSEDDLARMCAWLAEAVGTDVPVHFTAFHPDFRMQDVPPTPPATLAKAHDIARRAGLHYVYTGNISDPTRQSTYCPQCGQVLVGRDGYRLNVYALRQDRCRGCGTAIAGRFGDGPGNWGPRRLPIRISAYAEKPRANGPGMSDGGRQTTTEASSEASAKQKGEIPIVCSSPGEQARNNAMVDEPVSTAASEKSDIEHLMLTPDQERLILQAAGRRVIAAVHDQVPVPLEQSLAGLAQMAVAGAFVTLRRAGALRGCCGSLGNAMPLGRAIEHAAVAVVKEDRRFPPVSPDELPYLDMDVWLLGNMEPVLAQGSARRNAVIIGQHGLRIARGTHQGLLLPGVAVEHHLDVEGFLKQVCYKAGLPADAWQDDTTTLMTFQGHVIKGQVQSLLPIQARLCSFSITVGAANPIVATGAAQPRTAGEIRQPAVAGTFYPGKAEEINRTLDEWFVHKPEPEPWAAALVPHAGWVYSGRLAADVFSRVRFPKQVIVLAPGHYPDGAEWAVAPHRTWQLPGCCLDSDPELARTLAGSITGLKLDAAAHFREHAIEVQLPLVARLSPHSRVVGITLRAGKLEDLQRFGEQMAGVLAGLSERPLLVISSDMNHFADDAETRRRDRMAIDALASLDPDRLYRTVFENRISMCGVFPAVVALNALRRLNALNRCHEVGYTTSAEVTQDTRRCVGYAGMLFA